ncbi:hypothetical protein VTN02DRAFT_838 [Thermoascus thermophilus]
MSASEDSFSPSEISRSTFFRLLSCYRTTVREVYRDKLLVKSRPRGTRKARNVGAGGPEDAGARIDEEEEEKMDREIESFLQLDEWRFEKLPRVLRGRAKLPAGPFLEKDELVNLMEWKLKHGTYRPTLMGMIQKNPRPLVRKTTADAIASIPTADPSTSPDDAFPKESLETLTGPLRGVGTATASLILSVATADPDDGRARNEEIPFYSDELYLWLCLEDYPSAGRDNGDGDGDGDSPKRQRKSRRTGLAPTLKYNLREYRQLWDAVHALQRRLNRDAKPDSSDADETRLFSLTDVEKVAYVLGHIDVSGYFGTRDKPVLSDASAQELRQQAAREEDEGEAGGDGDSKKRKRGGDESADATKDQKSRKRE